MKKIMRQESGMTLVELLVSLVISSFIIAGVYGVYTVQKKSYTVQEQVAEMQQRLRSAMDFLARDIRIAGSNPLYEAACGNKITKAAVQEMVFNACNFEDKDNDGEADNTDYRITIEFDPTDPKGVLYVTRDAGMTGNSPRRQIADGVDWFEIQYILGYKTNGDPIVALAPVVKQEDRDKIRTVKVSILIRSTYPDMKYTDTNQYEMGSGATWSPSNPPHYPNKEHYHRRLLISTIELRNM